MSIPYQLYLVRLRMLTVCCWLENWIVLCRSIWKPVLVKKFFSSPCQVKKKKQKNKLLQSCKQDFTQEYSSGLQSTELLKDSQYVMVQLSCK